MSNSSEISNSNVYQKVTDSILKIIDEKGYLPWEKEWTFNGVLPCNFITKKPYRGFNLMITACSGFSSPYFLTVNQIKKLGGTWSGKGTLITFWNWTIYTKRNSEGNVETKKIPFLKYYYVWNEDQISGIEFPKSEKEQFVSQFGEIKEVENLIASMPNKPSIIHEYQDRAYYSPSRDYIKMPLKEQFSSLEAYYQTFSHELIHSTGHRNRLNREGIVNPIKFGSDLYSKEELIAELGACFLMNMARINFNINNSAAYIKGWRNKIASDNKLIISATSHAQKAVDYIIDFKYVDSENEEFEETNINIELQNVG